MRRWIARTAATITVVVGALAAATPAHAGSGLVQNHNENLVADR